MIDSISAFPFSLLLALLPVSTLPFPPAMLPSLAHVLCEMLSSDSCQVLPLPVSTSKTRCPASLSYLTTSSTCWCPCKVLPLSLPVSATGDWLPIPPSPSQTQSTSGEGMDRRTKKSGLQGLDSDLQRVCMPLSAQDSAIQADSPFPSVSQGLKHPGDSAAAIPPAGCEPGPSVHLR